MRVLTAGGFDKMKTVTMLVSFLRKKVLTVKEFTILFYVIVLNPLLVVALSHAIGTEFLIGLISGWVLVCALKTKWGEHAWFK
jgi:hypothetical protein